MALEWGRYGKMMENDGRYWKMMIHPDSPMSSKF
jgi:hypothetical protein